MKNVSSILLKMLLVTTTLCFLGVSLVVLLDRMSSQGPQCDPPRTSFSKSDLMGIWIAGSPDQRETLIIRPDGMYKQIVHIEFAELPPLNYESAWQKWWLEDKGITVPVLHLEGYSLCGYNAGISCDTVGGTGHHLCEVQYQELPNEGVLYVMGESEITLTLPLGLEDSWFYWKEQQ